MSSIASQSAPAQEAPGFDHVLAFDGAPGRFLFELVDVQRQLTGATAVAMLRVGASPPNAEGQSAEPPKAELLAMSPEATLDDSAPPAWLRAAAAELRSLPPGDAERVIELPGAHHTRGTPDVTLLAVRKRPNGLAVFAALCESPEPARAQQAVSTLRASSTLLDVYEARRTIENRQSAVEHIADVIETVEAVTAHDRFRAAAMALCNEVAARWNARRVTLGIVRSRYVRLEGMSQTEHIVRKMRLVRDAESAMEECADQDTELLVPEPQGFDAVTRVTGDFASRHGPASVLSLPLRRGGEVVGVLMVEREPEEPIPVPRVEVLRLLGDTIAGPIHELSRHDRWVGARIWSGTRRLAAAVVGPRHTGAKLIALAAAAILAFLLFGKGTDWVESPFTIEVNRRHIMAAPFDGYIASVNAEIGAAVGTGEPLITMDTTDLVLRLSSLKAELQRELTDRSMALREDDIARRDMADASADALHAEIALVETQLQRARMTTPIDAVVIEGEPERRIGGSVQRGEMLFELAPIDALRAELRVPARRIADVYEGQTGAIAPASHPSDRLPITVERIDPVGEVQEGENAFRVIVRFDEPRSWIRPGVEGVGRLDAGKQPYGWLLLRDAVNWVRIKLWI